MMKVECYACNEYDLFANMCTKPSKRLYSLSLIMNNRSFLKIKIQDKIKWSLLYLRTVHSFIDIKTCIKTQNGDIFKENAILAVGRTDTKKN